MQLLAYEDPNNMISGTLVSSGASFWGPAPTTLSLNVVPTIGGASNGSTGHTTDIPKSSDPSVLYVKVVHTDMRMDFYYSTDGLTYTRAQSADGRRQGESSYLPNAVFGLFVTGGDNNIGKSVYCEYMDLMSMNGQFIKDEQGVLNDAFKAVCDLAATMIPDVVDSDLTLTLPVDYAVRFEADDCIAEDGTLTRPDQDKIVHLKVTISHEHAKIDGQSSVVVFDGDVTVKAAAGAYGLDKGTLDMAEDAVDTVAVGFDSTMVMNVSAIAENPDVISVEPNTLTQPGALTVHALKAGSSKITVTFYGLPNNTLLGSEVVNVAVSAQ